MCGCDNDPTGRYVCDRCRGVWPFDPDRALEQDDKEREQERREADISRPDFLAPFRDAA